MGGVWRPVRDCPGDHVLVRLKLNSRQGDFFLSEKTGFGACTWACWRGWRLAPWSTSDGCPGGLACPLDVTATQRQESRVARIAFHSEPVLGSRVGIALLPDLSVKSMSPQLRGNGQREGNTCSEPRRKPPTSPRHALPKAGRKVRSRTPEHPAPCPGHADTLGLLGAFTYVQTVSLALEANWALPL